MQSPCALYVPHYIAQTLRARGKRKISHLTSRFRVASYCRRVDLVCDEHGIGGGGKHCDDNDARPDASAAETSTATTTMHSPTHRRLRKALQIQRCIFRPLFTRPA
jgi:hypothetical protein